MLLQGVSRLGKCIVEAPLYSLNKFTGGHWASKVNRKHWRDKKTIWLPLLRSSHPGLGVPVIHENKKRRVVIKRLMVKGERRFDKHNAESGSVKALVDALVTLGWLKDDWEKWLDLEVTQVPHAEIKDLSSWERDAYAVGGRTVVEIYDV